MPDYTKINTKWWNSITPFHAKSSLYNVKKFRKTKNSLQHIEIEELGNVRGKKILHLLCHFGMDSLSLVQKGAKVTGVDISSEAITLAKKLSSELKIPAEFICSDVYKLENVLSKKYDIIFLSYGVLLWLSNMQKFAKIVSKFLKKEGILYIVELHPFTNMLNEHAKMQYDYFDKGPFLDDADGSYTNWKDKTKGTTYEWSYTIDDVINAFISAGLTIEFFHEFPFTMYNQFPGHMKKNKKGQFILKDKTMQFPLLFSLQARKS